MDIKIANEASSRIKSFIEKLENSKITFLHFILTFFCLVFIRGFLEGLATGANFFSQTSLLFIFFHGPAFYAAIFLAIILIFHLSTKESIEKISRLMLVPLAIILLPPALDLLVAGVGGVMVGYRELPLVTDPWVILKLFFGFIFWGPFGLFFEGNNSFALTQLGKNYGIRIEILLILLFSIWYIFFKTKSVSRVLLGLFLLYLVFFVMGIFPNLMALLFGARSAMFPFASASSLNSSFNFGKIMTSLHSLFIIMLASCLFYCQNKRKFIVILKNARPLRLLVNIFALSFGITLALESSPELTLKPLDYLLILMAYLAVIFYWLHAVFSNDLADEKTDRISQLQRPLPAKELTRDETKSTALVFLTAGLICALLAGHALFMVIILRSSFGYLYSWPPFKLKRIPVLNTAVLSAGYFLTTLGGFLILETNTIYNFPVYIAFLIIAGFSLVINFKDIKDYQGDKKTSIMTLPVIFGLQRAKIIISILGAFAFFLPLAVFKEDLNLILIASLIASSVYFYLINKKNYSETPIFVLIFIYLVYLSLVIFQRV